MATEDLYREYLDMKWDDRVYQAQMSLDALEKFFKKKKMDMDQINYLFFHYFSLFMSYDGKGNNKELRFLCDVFECQFTASEFQEILDLATSDNFLEELKTITDNIKNKYRYDVFILGICIYSCDGNISVEAQKLLDFMLLKRKK